MGCFLACFGSSKDRKHRKRRHKVQTHVHRKTSYNPVQQSAVSVSSVLQENSEKPVISASEVGVKAEEQLSLGARKKVTFDSNVETYEHVLPEEEVAAKASEEGKKEKEESAAKSNQSQSSSEASSITSSGSYPPNHRYQNCREIEEGKKEKEESAAKSNQSQSSSEASSITSSGSYPPNHRYQNCRESDDEDELDYEDSDIDDDDDDDGDGYDDGELDYVDNYEDDIDGIVESRIARGKVDSKEVDSSMVTSGFNEEGVKSVMVNRAARDRSAYVHSVLNPVENLTQWKALKAKGKPQLKQQKENSIVDQEPQCASFCLEPSFQELSLSFKSKTDKPSKKANQEMAVDASLSNWLSSSETNKSSDSFSLNTTPEKVMSQSLISVRSHDDRPILGALTLEEIKQFSASNSPRKSPSRSPDEMPIIGTVGTYWSPSSSSAKDCGSSSSCKGIPNTTSKYRERGTTLYEVK